MNQRELAKKSEAASRSLVNVQRQIFETVQRRFQLEHSEIPAHMACAYLALIGLEEIKKRTCYRAVLQAGTMNWEIVPKHLDDGVIGTHLGFVWSPNEFNSVRNMLAGGIPEMHVWIGLPDQMEIVDFSTGTFPQFVVKTLKLKWLAQQPPDFLWQDIRQAAAEGHFYTPNEVATRYALNFKL